MIERIETMVGNIVSNEIMANASQFVQEMCNMGLVDGFDFVEQFHDCMFSFDYSEPSSDHRVQYMGGDLGWTVCDSDSPCDDPMIVNHGFDSEHEAIRASWDEPTGEEPPIIEAMEHWIVSDWLAEKLEEVEAPICRDVFGWNIWGRTETGQGLTEDGALHDVARVVQWQIDNALNRVS